jgi:PAS domain S-box-containing protein
MFAAVLGDALPAGDSADKILIKHSVVRLRRYSSAIQFLFWLRPEQAGPKRTRIARRRKPVGNQEATQARERIVVTPPHSRPAQLQSHSNEIFGSGEMAGLTRERNWAATPLGPIEHWPQALVILVNVILANPHPMFLWWGAELIQFYNDAYRQSLGSDKHPAALGQPGRDCWPEIWPIIGPQIEAVMERGQSTWHENALVPIMRNGKLEDVYWTYSYSPARNSSGAICGTLVTCTETTQKHLTELNLRQEVKMLGSLFQQAPAFFTLLRGPNHVFELANPLYQELIGPRPLIGKSVREAVPEAESQGFVSVLDNVYRTGETYIGSNTTINLARRGSAELETRILNFVYQPMRETDGSIAGIIVLGVDVTEAKRAEEALIQTEKLAAVGRLASSIAHEINNPLESVTNLLYLAQTSAVDPETKDYLNTAELELRRVAAITNQTLRFYRQSTRPVPVTVQALFDNTLPLYQGRLDNSSIELRRRERFHGNVTCLDGEIRQVLSNLIGNAIDAMNNTGNLLLLRSRQATHGPTGRRGVVVTVADNGSGMPASTQSRIFEPFFTTKDLSGTGLGLWITREIVQRHQGVLRVRSSQAANHSGTVFTVFLPCEEERQPSA